ncbi:beta-ketoacyl-[acyl-carrier-protein] synthase family protein [Streptomyces sp. NPDC051320]|uniref:beta-ketoacyl-[acyl-carrier-protein] synthase family protein n=1 Tax=Streptomyces sp. NPDC051320 TaxID=3154644 RepID=UPI0034136715
MSDRDIAVTGLGMVTPAGIGVTASWERVRSGLPTAAADPSLADNLVRISCRVKDFDPVALLGGRVARRLDPFVQFAIIAVREALADAGLDPSAWDGTRVGVVLGCGGYGAATLEAQQRVLMERSARKVSPQVLPMHLSNLAAGQVSIELGATGPSLVVATACASGATAIGVARDLLNLNRCDIVVAGGTEAMVTPLVIAGFAQMGALSARHDDPAAASRPFDAARDGFVAGEGSAVLVMERVADARARGARVRARVVGFGMSADAHHVTAPAPDGRGLEQSLRSALLDAGAGPSDIGHVNAHGTSTQLNDLVESAVIERVLGPDTLVTSTKGVTGHMLGAAGAVEAALTVLTIEHGIVPPTANLTVLDERIKLDVPTTARPCAPALAVSQSAAFGGQNAALVLAPA